MLVLPLLINVVLYVFPSIMKFPEVKTSHIYSVVRHSFDPLDLYMLDSLLKYGTSTSTTNSSQEGGEGGVPEGPTPPHTLSYTPSRTFGIITAAAALDAEYALNPIFTLAFNRYLALLIGLGGRRPTFGTQVAL